MTASHRTRLGNGQVGNDPKFRKGKDRTAFLVRATSIVAEGKKKKKNSIVAK